MTNNSLPLREFVTIFINKLNDAQIDHCVLRNYQELPDNNSGNDIDFLVDRNSVNKILNLIACIDGIVITGVIDRLYVISIFIYGIKWGDGFNALQLDLFTTSSWKNLSFLSTKDVLSSRQNAEEGNGLIKKPAPYHEAIISFFSSYLVGGWIKEKYQSNVVEIFKSYPEKIVAILGANFGVKLSKDFVDAMCENDKSRLYKILPKLKTSLLFHHLSKTPLTSFKKIISYYFLEIKYRFTPSVLTNVVFLGADGSGKSTIINAVAADLKNTTKTITLKHLKPSFNKKDSVQSVVTDPHSLPPRSALISSLKITYWAVLYWYELYFGGHKNLMLKIWDRYYYDLLVDTKRYRYGGFAWYARLIAKLVPKPDLIILLDAPAEVIQSRKKEVSFQETLRQQKAYVELVSRLENGFIVDATLPVQQVINEVSKAVIDCLVKKQGVGGESSCLNDIS